MLRGIKRVLYIFQVHRQQIGIVRFLRRESDAVVLRSDAVRRLHMNRGNAVYATFCHRDDLTARSRYRYHSRHLQRTTRQWIGIVKLVRLERGIRLAVYIQPGQQRICRGRERIHRERRNTCLLRREKTDDVNVRRSLFRGHDDTCRTVTGRSRNRNRLTLLTQDRDLRHRSRRPGEGVVQIFGVKSFQVGTVQIDHLQVSVLGFLHLEIKDIHPR